jgi:hypothetical protein
MSNSAFSRFFLDFKEILRRFFAAIKAAHPQVTLVNHKQSISEIDELQLNVSDCSFKFSDGGL